MDNSELLLKLENIEILVSAHIESMNKMLAQANDPKTKQKEADALTQASENFTLVSKEIAELIKKEKTLLDDFKPTVNVQQYHVDVKKPLFWIIGAILTMVISVLISNRIINKNNQLKDKNEQLSINDIKYRYLKIATINLKPFNTSRDVLIALDAYYANQPGKNYIDSFVPARERDLREAFEAAELARRNEAFAEQNAWMAKILKHKADSLKNKW